MHIYTSHKGNQFQIIQEDCTETTMPNSFFIDKLNEINVGGTGRFNESSLPEVHGAIWAMDGNTIAGGLFYDLEKSKESNGIWVVLAYIEPAYRQQGLYTELHNHLTTIAKLLGRKRIVTWFSLKNRKMFEIGKSVGYSGVMMIMERTIE